MKNAFASGPIFKKAKWGWVAVEMFLISKVTDYKSEMSTHVRQSIQLNPSKEVKDRGITRDQCCQMYGKVRINTDF